MGSQTFTNNADFTAQTNCSVSDGSVVATDPASAFTFNVNTSGQTYMDAGEGMQYDMSGFTKSLTQALSYGFADLMGWTKLNEANGTITNNSGAVQIAANSNKSQYNTNAVDASRIRRDASLTGNFDARVELTDVANLNNTQERIGMAFYTNDANWVLWGRFNTGQLIFQVCVGGALVNGSQNGASNAGTHFRITRVGNAWTAYISADGDSWSQIYTYTTSGSHVPTTGYFDLFANANLVGGGDVSGTFDNFSLVGATPSVNARYFASDDSGAAPVYSDWLTWENLLLEADNNKRYLWLQLEVTGDAVTSFDSLAAATIVSSTATLAVFLLAGQSNADGRGAIDDLSPPYDSAQPLVLAYTDGGGDPWPALIPGWNNDGENMFGPEIKFGYDAVLRSNGIPIGIIKSAEGGTSLAVDWCKGGDNYNDLMTQITNAQGTRTIVIKALIWVQGERDAVQSDYANAYQFNLTQFLSDIRSDLSLPNLPVVICKLHTSLPVGSYPYASTVRAAQVAVATADSYAVAVDTRDISLNVDNIHYDADGCLELGARAATALADYVPMLDPVTAPTNVFSALLDDNPVYHIAVRWDEAAGVDHHELRRLSSAGVCAQLDSTRAWASLPQMAMEFVEDGSPASGLIPLSCYVDQGLDLSTYTYEVRSVDADGLPSTWVEAEDVGSGSTVDDSGIFNRVFN